jgi:hypothetical protein
VDEQTDEMAAAGRPPCWLRPQAGLVLVVLLLLFDRWIGGGVIVPLASLVSVVAVGVLGLAAFVPRFRTRWFR